MIVFVHGVPETSAIWRKVQAGTARPSVALELPGFGNPRPEGFPATKEAYLDWLVDTLVGIRQPIDLVGHDWGAILTYGLVLTRAEEVPLRSWAADIGGIILPDYVWHDFAQIWQTPGAGEEFFVSQRAQPAAERAAGLAALFGLSLEDAEEMEAAGDEVMASCILDLYRSATPNPHASWGPISPSTVPGLVLAPLDDPFGDPKKSEQAAGLLGAQYAPIEGASHFWPYSAPEPALAVLEPFWSSVD